MGKMDKPIEEWRSLPGYDGIYEISNYGRVRSLDRYGNNNWGNAKRFFSGKILKPGKTGSGYHQVHICKDGVSSVINIHRAVAEVFIPNPDNLPQVNHIDEDKSNNAVWNLEWCTSVYNINYGTGLKRAAEKKGRKVECLSLDWEERKTFNSLLEAAEFLGVIGTNGIRKHTQDHYPYKGYYWRFI